MMDDKDSEILDEMRKYKAKTKRTMGDVLNSKNLSSDELDDLFLS